MNNELQCFPDVPSTSDLVATAVTKALQYYPSSSRIFRHEQFPDKIAALCLKKRNKWKENG